jgi:hypothetical protein
MNKITDHLYIEIFFSLLQTHPSKNIFCSPITLSSVHLEINIAYPQKAFLRRFSGQGFLIPFISLGPVLLG